MPDTCNRPTDQLDVRQLHRALVSALRRRLAADDKMKGPVPTLAENIARVMHELWPQRFPETQMGDDSNRLKNPNPFLR